MADDFSWETVPPWVYGFSKLNKNEVEIVEMTHPRVTGEGSEDQKIEDRMNFTVFLLRKAISQERQQELSTLAPNTFRDIQRVRKTLRGTQVGTQPYHAWQAVRYQNCDCKYQYEGTTRHTSYHNEPVNVDYWDMECQPVSVTAFL